MRIVVCGAGSTGLHLARTLAEGNELTLVERARSNLPEDVGGIGIVVGDAADPGVLFEAGARDADVLVAVTGDDPTNLVAARLAKHGLGVGSTVARMNDPAHEWLFTPAAGVDFVVSTAVLAARVIEEEIGR